MRSGKQGLTLATIVIVAVALTISALYFFVIRKPKQQNGRLSVSVRLKWLHQAQFAGFYVADAKGFYAQGGLKFVRATLNGWQYAVDHPQEAANIVLEYDRQLHYPHELAMMQESIPLSKPDAKPIGWMDQADWERMQQLLVQQGFLKTPTDVNKAFDSQFVRDFYARP